MTQGTAPGGEAPPGAFARVMDTMTWGRWLQIMCAVWVGALLAWGTVWLLGRVAPTLALFAAGFVVAYVLDPLLDRLEARGWSRGWAVWTVTAAVLVVVGLLGAWLVPMLVGQVQLLAHNWPSYSASLEALYEQAETTVREYAAQVSPETDIMPYLDAKVEAGRQWLEARLPQAARVLSDTVVRSVSLVGVLVTLALVSVNFMLVIDPFRHMIRDLLPAPAKGDVADITRKVNRMLGQYVRGQATMCLVMGVLSSLILLALERVFGTQYGLVLGVVAGVLYVVPWLGAATTNIAATAIGYLTAAHDPGLSALCALGAMALNNFICDNLISPRVIGQQVGLHPLVVIFAFLAGYQVMGLWGMLIAAPVAASIKIILARWLPMREVEAKRGRRRTLVLDVGAGFRRMMVGLEGVAQRVESAMGLETEQDRTHTTPEVKGTTREDDSGPA